MEDALHVERQHPVPGGIVELLEGCAPGVPGVVDQDVQERLAFASAAAATAAGLGGEIGGQRRHSPISESSRQLVTGLGFRDDTYTLAPASTYPVAIILPMPREPPVTRAVLPAMENRSVMACAALGGRRPTLLGP